MGISVLIQAETLNRSLNISCADWWTARRGEFQTDPSRIFSGPNLTLEYALRLCGTSCNLPGNK